MGRSRRCSTDEGSNRAAWTTKEDMILRDYINVHGVQGGWTSVRDQTALNRSGKSCRLRWMNYLRPNIKRGNISPEEDDLIIRLHRLLGNRWSLIAGRLPGRTDNEIKNYWNTHLRKNIGALNKRDRSEAKMTEEDMGVSPRLDLVGATQIAVNIENNVTVAQSFDEQSRALLQEDLTIEMPSDHPNNMASSILEDEELIFKHRGVTSEGLLGFDCAVQFPLSPISSSIEYQMSCLFSTLAHV